MTLWLFITKYQLIDIDFNSWNEYGIVLFLAPNIVIPSIIYEKRAAKYFLNLGILLLAIVFFSSVGPFFKVSFFESHSEPLTFHFFELSMAYASVVVAFVLDLNKKNLSKFYLKLINNDERLERKIAEKTVLLQKNALGYKNILNITPFGICVVDSSLKLIEVNIAFSQLTQYSEDEIIGLLSIDDLDKHLDRKGLVEFYQNSISEHEVTFIETELTRKDGTVFPAAVSLVKVGKGVDTMYYGTFSDITKRRITEDQINKQQEHLLEAQRIAKLGSWQVNIKANQVFWSDEVFRIFGEEPFEVTVADFYAYIHPDERAEVQRHFEKCAAEQREYNIIHRIITKTGEIKWVEEIATFHYDSDQNLLFADGTTQDITEAVLYKQNLELDVQKMNLALKGGDIMAWEYNINTNQMDIFPSDLESSHTPLANIKSLNDIYQYLHEDSQNQALRRIEKLDDGLSNTVVFESQIRDSSTGYRWYSCSVNVLERDEKGKAIKLFGVFQDIESKKNEELIEIRGQEEERVRVSRDIHDSIGQMLVGTRMRVNSNLDTAFEPKELQAFHREIDELLDLLIGETKLIINNLGVAIFNNRDLKETLDQCVERMSRIFPGQIEFNWQGKKSMADAKKELNVFRIFQECLTNAIRHADASKIEVDIRNEDGEFLMQFRDNGKGLVVPVEKCEFGLRNMMERAESLKGHLLFENDNGTSITLKID
ncbi:MAG: PAS domain S-box-containing protein [Cyclobacteriaceae bacterium]|jgi:PAS domain S-box-containing protein